MHSGTTELIVTTPVFNAIVTVMQQYLSVDQSFFNGDECVTLSPAQLLALPNITIRCECMH